jgi:hypothetical protein
MRRTSGGGVFIRESTSKQLGITALSLFGQISRFRSETFSAWTANANAIGIAIRRGDGVKEDSLDKRFGWAARRTASDRTPALKLQHQFSDLVIAGDEEFCGDYD